MTKAKKVSEITIQDVAAYLRLAEVSSEDETFLASTIEAAKSRIKGYTGRTAAEMDDFPEFTEYLLAYCANRYDNRGGAEDNANFDKMEESLLGMRSVNLL